MKNEKQAFVLTIIILAITSCLSFDSKKMPFKKEQAVTKGFAVIELFTSEGCSSCPSADELVRKVQKENKKNVYILAFHVDYWNRLGWKDVFSQPAFSYRQQLYSRHLSLQGVYTPQIVVNGTQEFVGSDEGRLRSALNNNLQPSALTINVKQTNPSNIQLTYANVKTNDLLNIAFIQPEAITDVKRGENGGRILHHVNIVRDFKTIEVATDTGSVGIEIPPALREQSYKIIAYTQLKKTFKITGVAETAMSLKAQ